MTPTPRDTHFYVTVRFKCTTDWRVVVNPRRHDDDCKPILTRWETGIQSPVRLTGAHKKYKFHITLSLGIGLKIKPGFICS